MSRRTKAEIDVMKAKALAHAFGAECEANPSDPDCTFTASRREQLAQRSGFDSWTVMPLKLQSEILRAFAAGRKAERKLR